MKRFLQKRAPALLALLLAAALLFLSGCLKIETGGPEEPVPKPAGPENPSPEPDPAGSPETDAPETEAPGSPDPVPEPEPDPPSGPPEIDFTLDDIRAANTLTALLSAYRCLTVRTESNGGVSHAYTFWNQDGSRFGYIVDTYTAVLVETESGESVPAKTESGMYRGLEFAVYPDLCPVAELRVPDLRTEAERTAEFDRSTEDFLADILPTEQVGEIKLLAYDEVTLTVGIDEMLDFGEEEHVPCAYRITLDRNTLALRAEELEYGVKRLEDIGGSVTVEYNGEKPEGAVSAAEDWEGTRTVTFEVVTQSQTGTFSVTLPGRWLLRLAANQGIYISTDPANPGGNGYGWVGAGTGSVTVWVRDEANLPIDVPEDPDGPGSGGLNADPEKTALPGFTLEELIEANRITNLTRKYGTVSTLQSGEFGETLTSFFRNGEEIVLYTEASNDYGGVTETVKYGSVGDVDFTLSEDGISLSVFPGGVYVDPEVRTTNADGEYYMYDLYVAGGVLTEGEIYDVKTGDGTVSFKITEVLGAERDDTVTYSYVVDAESLLIREYGSETGGWTLTVTVGEEIPFRKEFEAAYAETRKVLCHALLYGQEGDYLYTVPASWSFFLTVSDEYASFTADPEGLIPFENRIPPDGKDYEFWVSDAKG